ncbi:MAG: NAD(P)/FAD-dependent oxidoreductase, partial [Alphaproteobacteria bacterium]|nr:NAD(P)/FAD-dependent oxidoreductase [Alphaproteobacteria bacterium]
MTKTEIIDFLLESRGVNPWDAENSLSLTTKEINEAAAPLIESGKIGKYGVNHLLRSDESRLEKVGRGEYLFHPINSKVAPKVATPKVVVIGGGAGGATAARYIAKDSKGAIDVTLVEASKRYYTCFFSNLYIGGFRKYASIGHNYYGLAVNNRINVVHEWAASVDGAARTVTLASGGKLSYDKLVLSPGIALKYDSIAGYSPQAQGRMPHGWTSGTQAQQIRNQVMTMKKGGTFVMVAPPNPYRCPPGPYERVSMIAHLLKERNPTAKIIVLDPKAKFSKMGLFTAGWEKHYSGMVEWIGPEAHGGIKSVNHETMEIVTDLDTFKADAACVIPAMRAGVIAQNAGVTDGDWAPIIPATMASKADPNIY